MRHKKAIPVVMALISVIMTACTTAKPVEDKITVACYYFPNYHTRDTTDMRISDMHSADWSEWELVKEATPRFEGHYQPKVPLWGYGDEKDPEVMSRKIKAATDHGIDVFIFDWYTYECRPFLNRCIDDGFLKAKNTNDMKFALMWANHDWADMYPYTAGKPYNYLYSGLVTSEMFDRIGDALIDKYFTRPNYWLIDGKAYFSIYDIQNFINSFGSVEATVAEMEKLEAKAVKAGLKGIHWNLVAWGTAILPGQDAPSNNKELIEKLHFDSATSYVWVHHVGLPDLQTDFNYVRDEYMKYWQTVKTEYNVPYFPNVSMGWDPSPRTNQSQEWAPVGYPYTNTISNNSPENFQTALQMTKDELLKDHDGPRVLNINCWNEWTEGSYIEPDTRYGMAYLEAVKSVFKPE